MNDGAKLHARILIVEDNPGDQRLIREAFQETQQAPDTVVAKDGIEALDYLFRRGLFCDALRPDLILMDLNLPRKSGREVLAEIKNAPELMDIPVIVFSSSAAAADVNGAYSLHANCYMTKPTDLDELFQAIAWIGKFWLSMAILPNRE